MGTPPPRSPFRTRFHRYEHLLGIAVTDGVLELVRRDGSRHALAFARKDEVSLVAQRIERGMRQAATSAAPDAPATLSRGRRHAVEWIRQVLIADSVAYRTALPPERLWAILEDPKCEPSARVGAGLALRGSLDEGGRTRLRIVAASSVLAEVRFAFEAIARSPNTLDAHRLIRWSWSAGAQDAVVERLFRDFFIEGKDIGDHAVLIEAARAGGMDGDIVSSLLAGDSDKDEVRGEIAAAQNLGVTGVPFFIFDGSFALPGAQPPDVLKRAIRKALEKRADAAA